MAGRVSNFCFPLPATALAVTLTREHANLCHGRLSSRRSLRRDSSQSSGRLRRAQRPKLIQIRASEPPIVCEVSPAIANRSPPGKPAAAAAAATIRWSAHQWKVSLCVGHGWPRVDDKFESGFTCCACGGGGTSKAARGRRGKWPRDLHTNSDKFESPSHKNAFRHSLLSLSRPAANGERRRETLNLTRSWPASCDSQPPEVPLGRQFRASEFGSPRAGEKVAAAAAGDLPAGRAARSRCLQTGQRFASRLRAAREFRILNSDSLVASREDARDPRRPGGENFLVSAWPNSRTRGRRHISARRAQRPAEGLPWADAPERECVTRPGATHLRHLSLPGLALSETVSPLVSRRVARVLCAHARAWTLRRIGRERVFTRRARAQKPVVELGPAGLSSSLPIVGPRGSARPPARLPACLPACRRDGPDSRSAKFGGIEAPTGLAEPAEPSEPHLARART
ncbi:Hypothetical predicted protein, partial [Olea europaea subsp. europaea]